MRGRPVDLILVCSVVFGLAIWNATVHAGGNWASFAIDAVVAVALAISPPCSPSSSFAARASLPIAGASRASRRSGPRTAQPSASTASAASRLPTAGANLNPWPEQAEPTTIRPWRSRTNRSSTVVV
jgi:hypothetical protein